MGDVWWEPLAAWTANTTASPRTTAQPGLSGSCAAGFNLPAGMPLEVAVGAILMHPTVIRCFNGDNKWVPSK